MIPSNLSGARPASPLPPLTPSSRKVSDLSLPGAYLCHQSGKRVGHCTGVRVHDRYVTIWENKYKFETTSKVSAPPNMLIFKVIIADKGAHGHCLGRRLRGLRAGASRGRAPHLSQYSRDLGAIIEDSVIPETQAAAFEVPTQPGDPPTVGAEDTMAAEISEGAPRDAAMVAALAKRMRIAGAATSRETFKSMWSDVTEKSSKLANSSAADPPQFHGVVAATERLADIVNKNHEEWGDDVKRLGMAALMLYRSRQSDVSLLQHVQLLWVLLGGRELRAHSGRAYFYDHSLGHFEGFDGLMPPTVLATAGNAMLTLEGLFRSFKAPVARKDADVLNAIDSSIKEALAQNNNDLPSAMLTFHDNCMFNKGNNLLKAGSAAPGRQSESGGDGEDAEGALAAPAPDTSNSADSWFVLTAQTISKVSTKLQYELLGNKLVPYFIEWCSTDMQRVPGCAHADCCVLYDRSASENDCLLSSRSPENNIYLGIPSPLLDPVLDAAMERVQRVYEQNLLVYTRIVRLRPGSAGIGQARSKHRSNNCVLGARRRRPIPLHFALARDIRR